MSGPCTAFLTSHAAELRNRERAAGVATGRAESTLAPSDRDFTTQDGADYFAAFGNRNQEELGCDFTRAWQLTCVEEPALNRLVSELSGISQPQRAVPLRNRASGPAIEAGRKFGALVNRASAEDSIPFSQAWEQVKQLEPELFARMAQVDLESNDIDLPLHRTPKDIQQQFSKELNRLRREGNLDFAGAWEALKKENPELFAQWVIYKTQ